MKNMSACGITVLRIVVGIVFITHGSQKLFTYGMHGVAGSFTQMGIPLPAISSAVVTLVEFLGGIGVAVGLFTRPLAVLLAFDMLGAMFFVHFKNGFFLPGGYEYALTLLAACITLALAGAGSLAADSFVMNRR